MLHQAESGRDRFGQTIICLLAKAAVGCNRVVFRFFSSLLADLHRFSRQLRRSRENNSSAGILFKPRSGQPIRVCCPTICVFRPRPPRTDSNRYLLQRKDLRRKLACDGRTVLYNATSTTRRWPHGTDGGSVCLVAGNGPGVPRGSAQTVPGGNRRGFRPEPTPSRATTGLGSGYPSQGEHELHSGFTCADNFSGGS